MVYSGTKISVPYFLHSKEVISSNVLKLGHPYFLCFMGSIGSCFLITFYLYLNLFFWEWVYKISSFFRFVCFKKFLTLNILMPYELHLVCFCLRKPEIQVFWFEIIIPFILDLGKVNSYIYWGDICSVFYNKFIG